MEHQSMKVIRIRSIELNSDNVTAKAILDVRVGEQDMILTIPRMNFLTSEIDITYPHERIGDIDLHPSVADIKARISMLADLDDKGIAFEIKPR